MATARVTGRSGRSALRVAFLAVAVAMAGVFDARGTLQLQAAPILDAVAGLVAATAAHLLLRRRSMPAVPALLMASSWCWFLADIPASPAPILVLHRTLAGAALVSLVLARGSTSRVVTAIVAGAVVLALAPDGLMAGALIAIGLGCGALAWRVAPAGLALAALAAIALLSRTETGPTGLSVLYDAAYLAVAVAIVAAGELSRHELVEIADSLDDQELLAAAFGRAVHDRRLAILDHRPGRAPRPGRAITEVGGLATGPKFIEHCTDLSGDEAALATMITTVQRFETSRSLRARIQEQVEELQASGDRIESAGLAQRQRLQQRLDAEVRPNLDASAMLLRRVGAASAGAAGKIERARALLSDFVQAVYPTALADGGLAVAIKELADSFPLAVRLEVIGPRPRPEVEAAAYLVCVEALTNAAKYAGVTAATVRAVGVQAGFTISVRDDGVGGANPSRGSGLRGLADRVGLLGAQFSCDSPPGEGTTVLARFPEPARV